MIMEDSSKRILCISPHWPKNTFSVWLCESGLHDQDIATIHVGGTFSVYCRCTSAYECVCT